jgi:non-ribosomal peptide synthetase component F
VYSNDLFEHQSITALVDVFQQVLRRGLARPETPIAGLPLTDGLGALQGMGLLDIKKSEYPRDSNVIDVFIEQVAAHPERVAVKDLSSQLTFAQLHKRSDELAI